MIKTEIAELIAQNAVRSLLRDVARNHAATAKTIDELLAHAAVEAALDVALDISGQRVADGRPTAAARTLKTAVRGELDRRIAEIRARWNAERSTR